MNYSDVLGIEPARVVRPETITAAAAVVREATSVLPWSGGTGQDYGAPPRRADVLLDLTGLNRIIAHDHADLTITVEAGITLAALQAQLAQHQQFLPLDPPHLESATIGGILATDASGPLRLGYGTARDWLIGIKVLDARGRLIKGGGKVVKNVTGYDLPKLHIGALGTLGVIVEATFKVSPLPASARTLIAQATPASALAAAATRLWNETRPVSLLLHEDATGRYLVALYHGADLVTQEAAAGAKAITEALHFGAQTIVPEELIPETPPTALQVQLAGNAADAAELHQQLAEFTDGTAATVDTRLGVGSATATWQAVTDEARAAVAKALLLAKARRLRFRLLHGPLALRQSDPELLWYPQPASRVLQERLKETLDPQFVLNPGRFVSGI